MKTNWFKGIAAAVIAAFTFTFAPSAWASIGYWGSCITDSNGEGVDEDIAVYFMNASTLTPAAADTALAAGTFDTKLATGQERTFLEEDGSAAFDGGLASAESRSLKGSQTFYVVVIIGNKYIISKSVTATVSSAGSGKFDFGEFSDEDGNSLYTWKVIGASAGGEEEEPDPEPEPATSEEIVLWEGEAVVYDWNDCPSLLVKGGDILQNAGAYVGQEIRFYVTPTDPNWMCSILEGYGNDIYANHCAVGCCPSWDPDCTEWDLDANGGYISFTLTKAMLDFANEYNDDTSAGVFLAGGENVIITKIALVGGDAGDTPAEQNVISFTIETESGVTAEWSTDGETWTAYAAGAKAPEGDLYIRLTKADGGVKVVTQTLNDNTKAFDLSAETFGWAEYLGEALDGEFIIDDADELKKLAAKMEALGTEGITFKLGADIDMSEAGTFSGIGAPGVENFTAKTAKMFQGTFDGDNHTISNVKMINTSKGTGLFNTICAPAVIKNLTVDTVTYDPITAPKVGGGMLVGIMSGGTIENCTTKGANGSETNPVTYNAAGIVNRIELRLGAVTIKDCTNEADIYCVFSKIAGICSIVEMNGAVGSVTFENCANKGNIVGVGSLTTANPMTGKIPGVDGCAGILGYTQNTVAGQTISFKNCKDQGTLRGKTCGGMVGVVNSNGKVTALEGNQTKAEVVPVGMLGGTVEGFRFAAVADGVATYVADSDDVAGNDLKVYRSGGTVTLHNVGDSITLDTSLAQATVTTDVDNAEILQEGNTYTVQAKVVAVESVTLDQATAELTVGGEGLTLTATVNPENATDKTVTWTSSNPEVATVESMGGTGSITAVAAGEVTITATAGDKTATCTVTVKEPEPTTAVFTLTWDDNVSAVSYTIGGETTEVADLSTGWLTIDVELDTVVTVGASAKDWYKVVEGAGDVTVDEEKTVGIATSLADTPDDAGATGLDGVTTAEAKEWADAKEITPAQIAACDFAYDAYLMNTDLSAKPELTIVDIAEVDNGWAITVKGTAGESDIDLGNINGPLKVTAAATLEDLKTAEAIAYDLDVREGGTVIKISGENKNFMRVVVTK